MIHEFMSLSVTAKEWKLISNRDCPDLNRNDAGMVTPYII